MSDFIQSVALQPLFDSITLLILIYLISTFNSYCFIDFLHTKQVQTYKNYRCFFFLGNKFKVSMALQKQAHTVVRDCVWVHMYSLATEIKASLVECI